MAMTHARREQLAREQGFSSYREKRAASPEQRIAAAQRSITSNPSYARAARHQIGRAGVGGKRQIFETPAGTVVASNRRDVLASQARAAASRDDVVRIRAVVDGRSVELFSKSGIRGDVLADAIASAGSIGGALAQFASLIYGGEGLDYEGDGGEFGGFSDIQFHASES